MIRNKISENRSHDSQHPLCFAFDALPTHVLSILHAHKFGTFIENLEPHIIYPIFRCIYLSLPQDQHDVYVEYVDHFLISQSHTLDLLSPIPIFPPSLAARIFFPPLSETSTTVNPSANFDDELETTIPIPANRVQTIHLPNSTKVLSSSTQVLPQPEQICISPASVMTVYFQSFCNGHYCENYSEYHCPTCYVTAPGHSACQCLSVQCDYYCNWKHGSYFCPHQNCAICSALEYLIGDCLFKHLPSSQASAIYGGPSSSTL